VWSHLAAFLRALQAALLPGFGSASWNLLLTHEREVMNFEEFLLMQALKAKDRNSPSGLDSEMSDSLIDDAVDNKRIPTRNLCASVSPQMFDKVDFVCDLLYMSKRRFIEECIVEGLKKADKVFAQVELFTNEKEVV
jgi:hypothetical protein